MDWYAKIDWIKYYSILHIILLKDIIYGVKNKKTKQNFSDYSLVFLFSSIIINRRKILLLWR